MKRTAWVTILCTLLAPGGNMAQPDGREQVKLPDRMRQHMLANMRDHLQTLAEIQAALAGGEFDRAAQTAEERLGMSSLTAHGASHMAPYMPQGMQAIGTEMHRAASRFAVAAAEDDLPQALAGLAKVTEQCVACHAAYRVH